MEHEIPASSKIMGNVITMRLAVYNNYLRGRRGVKGRERESKSKTTPIHCLTPQINSGTGPAKAEGPELNLSLSHEWQGLKN